MWKEGVIKINSSWIRYEVKAYDSPSQFGIDGGRISKLILIRKGEIVCNYEREWIIKPVDLDAEMALQILIFSENH